FRDASGALENVARWDGVNWIALGSGIDNRVWSLAVHDDGSGPALYAGGWYTSGGGGAANSIARWNGVDWSAVGGGMSRSVLALASFDAGNGRALFAGG